VLRTNTPNKTPQSNPRLSSYIKFLQITYSYHTKWHLAKSLFESIKSLSNGTQSTLRNYRASKSRLDSDFLILKS
jgi:hypothetical protein